MCSLGLPGLVWDFKSILIKIKYNIIFLWQFGYFQHHILIRQPRCSLSSSPSFSSPLLYLSFQIRIPCSGSKFGDIHIYLEEYFKSIATIEVWWDVNLELSQQLKPKIYFDAATFVLLTFSLTTFVPRPPQRLYHLQ